MAFATRIEDLPEDIQKLAIQAAGLREQNVGLFRQLAELGGDVELGVPRLEHFINKLVELGVITEKDRWEEAVSWEADLRGQLKDGIEDLKRFRIAEAEEFTRQQRLNTLLGGRQV